MHSKRVILVIRAGLGIEHPSSKTADFHGAGAGPLTRLPTDTSCLCPTSRTLQYIEPQADWARPNPDLRASQTNVFQFPLQEETGKSLVTNILAKLGANDRTHAVTLALKRGIIEL